MPSISAVFEVGDLVSGADFCRALGGIIYNFSPILPYFQHRGEEACARFFQVRTLN